MRRLTALLAVALVAGPQGKPRAPSQPGPDSVIAQLYRDFAWEAVLDVSSASSQALIDQPRPVLRRYFDDRLTALILQDRACAARTHEICRLDFDPLWASQDPDGAHGVKVQSPDSLNVVRVALRYTNGYEVALGYRMSRTKEGWRIADIDYASGPSLLTILSSKH